MKSNVQYPILSEVECSTESLKSFGYSTTCLTIRSLFLDNYLNILNISILPHFQKKKKKEEENILEKNLTKKFPIRRLCFSINEIAAHLSFVDSWNMQSIGTSCPIFHGARKYR